MSPGYDGGVRRLAAVIAVGLASCSFEPARPSADAGPDLSMCGDGVVDPTEACDDDNTRAGDGCDGTCRVERYHTCVGEPSECSNPGPMAKEDELYVDVGQTAVLDVLANDTDLDDDPLRIEHVEQSIFGTLVFDDTQVTFTGTSTGVDFVNYRIRDSGDSRSSARIQLRVGVQNRAPRALSQTVTVDVGTSLGIRLEAIDEDDDALTFTIQRAPTLGTIASVTDDLATYEANPGATGRDTFTFTASDGELESETATVTVDLVGGWWNEDWRQRRRVRIDTTGFTNVADVPVRIRLPSATVLMNEGARADGADLRFVSLDGERVIPHELVGWPQNYAAAWIRIDDFDAPEVALWLYYGNNGASAPTTSPWSAAYHTVFHFDDDVVDSISGNSAANSNRFALFSTLTGRGLVVEEEESVKLDVTPDFTIDVGSMCLWMLAAGRDGPVAGMSRGSQGQGPAGDFSLRLSNDRLECSMDDGNDREMFTTGQTLENGWHYVCLRWDVEADTVELVRNGVVIGMSDSTQGFDIDSVGFAHADEGFEGPIDEVWLMSARRSNDWIRAQAVLGAGSVITTGTAEARP